MSELQEIIDRARYEQEKLNNPLGGIVGATARDLVTCYELIERLAKLVETK